MVNVEGENRYSYNRNSLLKRIHYASGATADYSYDAASRISALSNQHNGAVVSSYSYRYDANGNRLEQTEQNGFGEERTTYVYDRADRLTEVVYPDQHDTYTYDPAWNRVTETVADSQGTLLSSKVLGYNSRNQLTDITDSIDAANNATFGYDEIGNQVAKVKDGITTTYVYDARNHLREVTTGGSTVGQFLYDYRGLRTEKQGDRGTERYSYDDQSVLFQSDASNAPTAKYEYGPNRLLSLKQTGLASEFYLFDALRSPVTLVRKDGSISARYAYNAWGEKRHESGASFNRFGFTGHEHDTETGLIYAKARYYDPDTARFLSQDPFAGIPDMPPSLHKYLYAYQNPTVFVDPDGRLAALEVAVAAGVVYLGVTVLTLETNNQLQKGMPPPNNRASTAPLMSVPPSYQGDTDIGSIPDVSVITLIKGAYVVASELFVAEDETGVGTTVTPMQDPIPASEGYPAEDLGLPTSTDGDQIYDQDPEDYIYSQPYQDGERSRSTSYPDQSNAIDSFPYLREQESGKPPIF